MAKFRTVGESVPYTPVADVVAGQLVKYGNYVGVADNPIPANTLGALRVTGIYSVVFSGADAGPVSFGKEYDIHVANQKAIADGSGDANIKVFAAEAYTALTDGIEYNFFLNRVGG